MNVETDRLLSADAKFTRFLKADNKKRYLQINKTYLCLEDTPQI